MMPLARGSQSRCSSASSGWLAASSKIESNRNSPSSNRPPGSHSTCRKNSGLRPLRICSVCGLVAFEEERGENPLAPGLVVAIIRAERLVHGGAEVGSQLLELGPQLLRAAVAHRPRRQIAARRTAAGRRRRSPPPAAPAGCAAWSGRQSPAGAGRGWRCPACPGSQTPGRSASECRSAGCRSKWAGRGCPPSSRIPSAPWPRAFGEWN